MANRVQQAPTIFSSGNYTGSEATNLYDADKPSRLSYSTEEIRYGLLSRNLYGGLNQYPLAQTDAQRVVESINSVINIVLPFRSYDLKNTVYGRLITNPSPLTEIGLIMLGKQFTMNFASHVAQQTFQVFKPSNLFDGNKDTKLFEVGKQFKITQEEDIGTFTRFMELVTSKYPRRNFEVTTLDAKDRNDVLIKNTGGGQIDMLYKNISRNVYREDNKILQDKTEEVTGLGFPSKVTVLMNNDIRFFNFDNNEFYPYTDFSYRGPVGTIIEDADIGVAQGYGYAVSGSSLYEYAPNKDFIDDNFGVTNKTLPKTTIGDISEFRKDNVNNKIVWGRDDVSKYANQRLSILRGLENDPVRESYYALNFGFNVKTGLLNYTKQLLNASEGKLVDITRKAFDYGNSEHGFNGSGLWIGNDSKYAQESGTAKKQGVRQHSVLDPYGRFTKAIRFNGNNVYGGNPNSVIYDTVMPRIHPIIDSEGKFNNKNLMFSIENLAIYATKDEDKKIGFDDLGGFLPYEEVGPFNGRIMWFPPYAVEFNETSTAKFESTVMVGRNEPIYNYINSERSVNLNWTMIIDYPPQLRNYLKTLSPEDRYKEIADFFAFGGNKEGLDVPVVDNPDEEIAKREKRIEEIKGQPEDVIEPDNIQPAEIRISFPNDMPTAGQVNTIFDTMYTAGYEVADGIISPDGTQFGLNSKIFADIGRTGDAFAQPSTYKVSPNWDFGGTYSQYTTTESNALNTAIQQVFDNDANWGYYKFVITAGSSKLYLSDNEKAYNQALSERRVNAVKELIRQRMRALYSNAIPAKINSALKFETSANGSDGVKVENLIISSSITGISAQTTKEERYASILIIPTGEPQPKNEATLTTEQQQEINTLQEEIEYIKAQKNKQKAIQQLKLFNERRWIHDAEGEIIGGDDGILDKAKSITENYYYPVFHSQTPEDFHRRLTFLQQCVRQGTAQRKPEMNQDGYVRAKNSVFGRQPICILRIGDFFYTKVIIESINIDYSEATWDMNPEGFGMQPMIAKITTQMKVIGGQSLKGPIDALQNAISYNYYANSTFSDKGLYRQPSYQAALQEAYNNGIDTGVYEEKDGRRTRTGSLSYEEVLKLLEEKTE